MKNVGQVIDANFPKDIEGRVYHLGLKYGELASKIVMVGDPLRAQLLSELLDKDTEIFYRASNRGFAIYNGTYRGVPVSIMSIGMGLPMMDFAVRESRAIVEGPLSIIRLGTCGAIRNDVAVGTVVAAESSFLISTDYDAYLEQSMKDKFKFTSSVYPSTSLHENLCAQLKMEIPTPYGMMSGVDATADYFYSSQGRLDKNFADDNENILKTIMHYNADVCSVQMETFQLFYLAHIGNMLNVAACAIVLAQRTLNQFLNYDELKRLEVAAGKACLKALIQ